MKRSYYSATISDFLDESVDVIVGRLSDHTISLSTPPSLQQLNAWKSQIEILQSKLARIPNAHIAFEYVIPRMGKRVDVVVLYNGRVFVLEFKVGEQRYPMAALEQALDYALDLKNFHEQSHERDIVPILVATQGHEVLADYSARYEDGVFHPFKCNGENYLDSIWILNETHGDYIPPVDVPAWLDSMYRPTPTIVEAAQALYEGHQVEDITRPEAEMPNLTRTANEINAVISAAKKNHSKAICFITGVPGSGKTLAGLNVACKRSITEGGDHAVFLSGNGPLVKVLQEALARDKVRLEELAGKKLRIGEARTQTKAFIQNIHNFRDEFISSENAPAERVVVFDEAQRAWDQNKTSRFMADRKGIADFDQSEPEFLIGVIDRIDDWAVIVCLVGGGQEINTGEAGLSEWFDALKKKYCSWSVYVSDRLEDRVYTNGEEIYDGLNSEHLHIRDDLHLAVTVRSFRAERLSDFVEHLLDGNREKASQLIEQMKGEYPIVVTRNIDTARKWLNEQKRGSESIGIVASSGGDRLRPYGFDVKRSIDPALWFLNDAEDVRSSDFLEDIGTEFDVQGLELDWICVAWDANLRRVGADWEYYSFKGTKWQNVNKEVAQRYLLNSYRVLLTRARQGMVIFVPPGDEDDVTRLPEFYDGCYNYLVSNGLVEI